MGHFNHAATPPSHMQNSAHTASVGTHEPVVSLPLFYLLQEIEKLTRNKADTPDAQQFPVPQGEPAFRC